MSRRPARFTQADMVRAIKAIQQAGACMAVEVALDGTLRVVPAAQPQITVEQERVYRL